MEAPNNTIACPCSTAGVLLEQSEEWEVEVALMVDLGPVEWKVTWLATECFKNLNLKSEDLEKKMHNLDTRRS